MDTVRTLPTRPDRDPLLDNGKFVLIVLVVVGHFLEALSLGQDAGARRYLYLWIYSFHMPAFALVSGYLSRRFELDGRRIRSLVSTLLLPYLIFEFIHFAEQWFVMGSHRLRNPVDPQWTLWFLLALFSWRLATPILRRLRHPLVVAVVVSLLSGLDKGLTGQLALNRTLAMLPFFTLGLVMTPQHWVRLRTPLARWSGAAVLALVAVLVPLVGDSTVMEMLYFRTGYRELDLSLAQGAGARLVMLTVGSLAAMAFWAVAPGGRRWWTTLGQASLYVYLWHSVFWEPVKQQELIKDWTQPWQVVGVVAAAVVFTFVFSSKPVRWLTRPLVEPRVGWLFRTDSPPGTVGPQPAGTIESGPHRPAAGPAQRS